MKQAVYKLNKWKIVGFFILLLSLKGTEKSTDFSVWYRNGPADLVPFKERGRI